MDISNRPVTSREYRLMLNVDRIGDRGQASQEFFGLLDFLVGKEGEASRSRTKKRPAGRLTWIRQSWRSTGRCLPCGYAKKTMIRSGAGST